MIIAVTDISKMKRYPIVLAIAGSDSGGGAGIQADIKAISATGSYAACAITAVTVQNTLGVQAVHNVPADIVRGQIDAVLDDIGADVVKIGMLGSAELVRTVKTCLEKHGFTNIVLDPVMVATSGDTLTEESAIPVLERELCPFSRLLTPNIPEAEVLSGMKISSGKDLPDMARFLSGKMYGISGRKVSVLMKAGHLDSEILVDYLYNAEEDRILELRSPKIESRNTHGTGCTLSSAVASYLAQGCPLDKAVTLAKEYITRAISSGAGYSIGHGHGPVNHFGDNGITSVPNTAGITS